MTALAIPVSERGELVRYVAEIHRALQGPMSHERRIAWLGDLRDLRRRLAEIDAGNPTTRSTL